MNSRRFRIAAVALAATACADATAITEPRAAAGPLMSAQNTLYDVAGDWTWSREGRIIFPEWVAVQVFGIESEGPMTSARCTSAGTMSIAQDGATFTGTAFNTSGGCVTRGGQVFPGVAPEAPVSIVSGRIHGKSLQFHRLEAGGAVDCAIRAVIAATDNGAATEMTGGGPCFVPGHPRSAIPAAPPPAGVEHHFDFTAVRL